MGRFIVIRFLQSIAALFGISLLVFVLVRLSGDPTMLMRTSTSTEADIALIKHQLGLDKSQPEQFYIFLRRMAHLDFGKSLTQDKSVSEMIGESLPNTLRLMLPSYFLAMLVSVLLGVLSATRRDTILDNVVKFLAIMGQALPSFWLAIVLIFIFSVYWPFFPAAGMGTPMHYILPVFTLAFFILPGMMRLVRSSMLDTLDSEYIKLARIKGLSEGKVIWKHALRNALIAPLTTAGMVFVMLFTNTVIIENVFNWPGLGRLVVEALVARDFPVVQGTTILVAALVLLVNLIVDILYAVVDPQMRYQRT